MLRIRPHHHRPAHRDRRGGRLRQRRAASSGAASLAPARSLIYGEATLDPSEDQQRAIDALIEKFPGEGSAGERIRGLLEKAFSESDTGLSFEDDVEPWLGDEAGFFVSRSTPGGEPAAPPSWSRPTTRTRPATRSRRRPRARARRELQGPRLLLLRRRRRRGRRRRLGRARRPPASRPPSTPPRAAPRSRTTSAYTKTLADAAEERLGFIYLNTPAFVDQLKQSAAGAALGPFADLFKDPVLATLDATSTACASRRRCRSRSARRSRSRRGQRTGGRAARPTPGSPWRSPTSARRSATSSTRSARRRRPRRARAAAEGAPPASTWTRT